MRPSAKIILDSLSEDGHRLTTMEVVYHRFVLAEYNTHRIFSRSSASSRAIPVQKQLNKVIINPALPVKWASEQKGMQGGDEIEDTDAAITEWLRARDAAVDSAQVLTRLGVHKSIVNRLLEPFMWHTCITSATSFSNFFAQRVSPLAQPELEACASLMRDAYELSEPTPLAPGDWHTPYIQPEEYQEFDLEQRKRVSVARCARVSYLSQAGVRDVAADEGLYERLVSASPPHAAPLEMVATPWPENVQTIDITADDGSEVSFVVPRLGNFVGWRQLRHGAVKV